MLVAKTMPVDRTSFNTFFRKDFTLKTTDHRVIEAS